MLLFNRCRAPTLAEPFYMSKNSYFYYGALITKTRSVTTEGGRGMNMSSLSDVLVSINLLRIHTEDAMFVAK